jgi:hypothetical protein
LFELSQIGERTGEAVIESVDGDYESMTVSRGDRENAVWSGSIGG